MKDKFIKAVFFVFILADIAIVSFGQTSSAPSAEKIVKKPKKVTLDENKAPNKSKELNLLQQRAKGVLNTLVTESSEITDNKLKVKTLIGIADLLWDYDERKSRSIFEDTFRSIQSLKLPENKSNNPNYDQVEALLGSLRFQLRHELLSVAATHNFDFAEKLRNSIEDNEGDKKAAKSEGNASSQEQRLQLLLLAKSLIKSNPEKATQIIRENLRIEISPMLVSVLIEMRHENIEIANKLFSEALLAAQAKSGSLFDTVGTLALYVMQDELEALYGRDPANNPQRATAIRQFTDITSEIIARQVKNEEAGITTIDNQIAQKDFLIIQLIKPLFTRFSPNSLPTISLREGQLTRFIPQPTIDTFEKTTKESDFVDTERSADEAKDSKQKDRFYAQAARQAIMQERPEEAVRISEKINDKEFKQYFQSTVRFQIAKRYLSKKDLILSYRYAKEITYTPQRVEVINQITQFYIDNKDIQRATEISQEMQTWLAALTDNPQKAQGLLLVAGILAKLDSVRGFEAAKLAVITINNSDFGSIEKTPTNRFETAVKIENLNFSLPFAILGKKDFEKALLICQEIKQKDIQILAQLSACQAILPTN